MTPPTTPDRKRELFEIARRLGTLIGIQYGEIQIKVHEGEVTDVVEIRRHRDDAGR